MSSESEALALFELRFGIKPKLMVQAPGRANLIGEHTDYSMLPVLPMAIDRGLVLAADEAAEPGIEAASAAYPEVARIAPGSHSAHGWAKYLEAILAELGAAAMNRGARIAIAGDLPPESGLSSSSALTVGAIGLLNELWALGLDREAIAAAAIRAERRLGVETGGMDQAAISFGEAGHAIRIDFQPSARRLIPVPEGWAVIVASSGEPAPKAGIARQKYNERVIGTRLAAALLAEIIGLDPAQTLFLGDVASTDVVDLLAEDLPLRATVKDVARATDVLPARLAELSHSQFETQVPVLVRGPAVHVLAEAQRVDAFEAAMLTGDGPAAGAILAASHASLRDHFACSTPALNTLVKAMGKAGAWGARLTGAGFGGFALALADESAVEAVIEAAVRACGGPAFVVRPSAGWRIL